ncbi:unnamed protein product [Cylindrotheca closterium]|uniref:Uncharacterized protein n=1 Tax=Cylindrotheca closterium TaxID=2856 RepID=A0AAD2CEB3_9STRA|nr:unnamed protein product [Cylindrotheca closterium]
MLLLIPHFSSNPNFDLEKKNEDKAATTNGQEEKHCDTDSSSPDVSQQNTHDSSPESDQKTTSASALKDFASTVLPSVGITLKTLLIPRKEISSPSRSATDETHSKPSHVKDLNSTRFDNKDPRSYTPRYNFEDDSIWDNSNSGSSSSSDRQRTGDFFHGQLEPSDVTTVETDRGVVEITNGMNQLTLSLDIDGTNADPIERATDLPPLVELWYDFPSGNILLSVDGIATHKIPLNEVQQIVMGRSCYHARSFLFGRNLANCQDPTSQSR